MDQLRELICRVKNGDGESFEKIAERMKCTIEKYVRSSFWEECEDARQEYILALWEAIMKMKYFDNEGQCVLYLNRAVEIRYYELQRRAAKITEHEEMEEDIEGAAKGKSKSTEIEDFLTVESIRQVISGETGLKREILYALYIEEKSDAEVANQCQVSRQYVNRIRKKYASLLRKQLYEERS